MEFEDKLERLRALTFDYKIGLAKCDDGSVVIVEVWHYPERRESDPHNEYEFYPIAKYLTEDEIKELKMEGACPEFDKS